MFRLSLKQMEQVFFVENLLVLNLDTIKLHQIVYKEYYCLNKIFQNN